ncbi:MAG TPA: hypothetical protein VN643_23655 [Pyrinomonadaceae bacterium]|nr:hypothetical protein [Pyrinomonadaceae bacterium]
MSTEKRELPYKGLIPYVEEDAKYFFGRENERNFITANLLAERLTLLYGGSGVGKSSILRAGVSHHLIGLAQENVERLGKPKYVVVFFNDWREPNTLGALLGKVEGAIKRTLPGEQWAPIGASLSFTESLLEWSRRCRAQLLIILDQFEEYFLYHQNEDGPGTFAQEFPQAVKSVGLPANFLLSFREDAFAKLAFFKVRMPDVFGNYLQLNHLTPEAGRDAIQKPLDQYNTAMSKQISIEPELVTEVLRQVETGQVIVGEGTGRGTILRDQPSRQIETPFLQMVMMRLWDEEMRDGSSVLRLKTLEQLADKATNESGAERIVRTHLDGVMKTLSAEEQDIAAEVFHYLVTPGGTKIAHTIGDLSEYASLKEEKLKTVLEVLASGKMRILRGVSGSDGKEGQPRYEIFHDVLAAPILDWRRRRVREQEQIALDQKVQKERAEAEAKAREEEKAKSAIYLRWAAVILGVMGLIAVIAAGFAIDGQLKATAEARKAHDAQVVAENQTKLAKEQADTLKKQTDTLKTQTDELIKARSDALLDKQKALDQANLATRNERKAKSEKSKADSYLRTSTVLLDGDLEAAESNYSALDQLPDGCDLLPNLRANYKEFDNLRKKYEGVGVNSKANYAASLAFRLNERVKRLTKIMKCAESAGL